MHLIVPTTPDAAWERLLPLFEAAGHRVFSQEHYHPPKRARVPASDDAAARTSAAKAQLRNLRHHLASRDDPMIVSLPGFADSRSLLKAIKGHDRVAVIAFYSHPTDVLTKALGEGRDAESALADWQQSANALVEVFRGNRQRVRIFCVDHATAAPSEFCGACNDHFGLSLSGDPIKQGECADPDNSLRVTLASAWVSSTPGLQQLVSTLEACAIPLIRSGNGTLSPTTLDQARKRIEDFDRLREEQARQKEREEEHQAVLRELCGLQEKLELERHQLRNKEDACAQLTSELKELKQKYSAVDRKLRDVRKHRDRVRRDRDRIKKILNGMKRSRSWRMTTPLRLLRHPRHWYRRRGVGASK